MMASNTEIFVWNISGYDQQFECYLSVTLYVPHPVDINNDLGNFVLPEGLTQENRTKVSELRFAVLIAQTGQKTKDRKREHCEIGTA